MSDLSLILDKEKTTEQMFKVCDYYKVKNIDIAEFLDTSEVEVSLWKSGKRFPGWDKIMLFAYVFDLSLDELIIRKKSDENDFINDIRSKIEKVNQKNLHKTLKRKSLNNENLNPDRYINVRWNPLVQDWVPIEKYNEIIEKSLENRPKTE